MQKGPPAISHRIRRTASGVPKVSAPIRHAASGVPSISASFRHTVNAAGKIFPRLSGRREWKEKTSACHSARKKERDKGFQPRWERRQCVPETPRRHLPHGQSAGKSSGKVSSSVECAAPSYIADFPRQERRAEDRAISRSFTWRRWQAAGSARSCRHPSRSGQRPPPGDDHRRPVSWWAHSWAWSRAIYFRRSSAG